MRSIDVEVGGACRQLVANWSAAQKMVDRVADPLFIAQEAAKEATLTNSGILYTPKFRFDLNVVVDTIHIGLEAGGTEVTRDEVGQWVFDTGLDEAQGIAAEYIGIMVTAQSKVIEPSEGDDEPGKT